MPIKTVIVKNAESVGWLCHHLESRLHLRHLVRFKCSIFPLHVTIKIREIALLHAIIYWGGAIFLEAPRVVEPLTSRHRTALRLLGCLHSVVWLELSVSGQNIVLTCCLWHKDIMEPVWYRRIIILHYVSLNSLFSHHSSRTVFHQKGLLLSLLYFLPVFHECHRYARNPDAVGLEICQLIPQVRCLYLGIHLRACTRLGCVGIVSLDIDVGPSCSSRVTASSNRSWWLYIDGELLVLLHG